MPGQQSGSIRKLTEFLSRQIIIAAGYNAWRCCGTKEAVAYKTYRLYCLSPYLPSGHG